MLERDEQFLMEVGMEFHVAGELYLKVRRPKSVDIYGTIRHLLHHQDRKRIRLILQLPGTAWGQTGG